MSNKEAQRHSSFENETRVYLANTPEGDKETEMKYITGHLSSARGKIKVSRKKLSNVEIALSLCVTSVHKVPYLRGQT
jgi:hypothetical protein